MRGPGDQALVAALDHLRSGFGASSASRRAMRNTSWPSGYCFRWSRRILKSSARRSCPASSRHHRNRRTSESGCSRRFIKKTAMTTRTQKMRRKTPNRPNSMAVRCIRNVSRPPYPNQADIGKAEDKRLFVGHELRRDRVNGARKEGARQPIKSLPGTSRPISRIWSFVMPSAMRPPTSSA